MSSEFEDELFKDDVDLDHSPISNDRASCLISNEILNDNIIEKREDAKRIWKTNEQKQKLEETLKGITRIIEIGSESEVSIAFSRITDDIWNLSKSRLLNGNIKWIDYSDTKGIPLLFMGKNNSYIIAPRVPAWDDNRNYLPQDIEIDEEQLPKWLQKRLASLETEYGLKGNRI